MDEAGEVILDFGSDFRDMLSAEDVHGREGDGEVDCGKDDVYAERIPAVGLDEVFETLREGSIWRKIVTGFRVLRGLSWRGRWR